MEYIKYNGKLAKKTRYTGYYCTKDGEILSVKIKGGQGRLDYLNPRLHSQKVDKDGYLEVCISYMDGAIHKRKYIRSHRLIWETFNGLIEDELTIDHIDHDRQNNKLENLQLLSRIDNGVKRSYEWVDAKSKKYTTFIDGEYVGIFTKRELNEQFGLTKDDILKHIKGKVSKRIARMKITLKENVEDIERVA